MNAHEQWVKLCNALKDIFNQPLAEIIATIVVVLVAIVVIISKTSLGKKALLKVTNLVINIGNSVKLQIAEWKAEREKFKQELADFKNKHDKELNDAKKEIDRLRALLEITIANSHNQKSIKALEKYHKESGQDGREEN